MVQEQKGFSSLLTDLCGRFLFVPFVAILVFSSCRFDSPATPTREDVIQSDTTTTDNYLPVKSGENKDRDVWQKPNIVIDMLGDLSQMTVADIGAGTGYFTFRFALKAQRVIAIDIDNRFLDIINTFKRNLPGDVQERIETRLARPDNPMLNPEEADLIVIINTIGYIGNRKNYLKTLLPGLKKGGRVVILDYKMKNLPLADAPPPTERVHLNILEDELASVGYDEIQTNDTALDYQYIVFASKPR